MSLYDVSVVVFIHHLERVNFMLQKVAKHIIEEKLDEEALLKTSLKKDMFPFGMQVLIGMDFSLRAIKPLLNKKIIVEDMPINTLEQLQLRLQNRIEILNGVSQQDVDDLENLKMADKAGDAIFEANGSVFIMQYAMPNFFFHLCMAHAILRCEGYPIGKGDFDGIHQYQRGFSFFEANNND
ncbi:DUF1993 family protein [Iodobacter fluviatilis]|uniref:DUF1993 domain-containing protein n=1 Tax=Iodobacter fluviatilis TaxID=537 RepID=A0A7G3G736_9NEIS|nr:DUF1993 domain-containing protein [Iodobacter fluviatilis]QBC43101.1 hypothetical protein C1H71_05750 [Iodobacter fluviatilis]